MEENIRISTKYRNTHRNQADKHPQHTGKRVGCRRQHARKTRRQTMQWQDDAHLAYQLFTLNPFAILSLNERFNVTRKIEQIPTRIRQRIDEIHRSFIFSNWMSVIALSRCLLEYAIIDRKSCLGLEIYRDENKTRKKSLR